MKKIWIILLVLAMIVSLAACGSKRDAEVVVNVDPNDNTVVIETPPAIVSGTESNPAVEIYPAASALPTTAPTTVPSLAPTLAPSPSAAPTAAPAGNNNDNDNQPGQQTGTPGRDSEDYHATISQAEIDKGSVGYVTGEGVNFRVGPGVQYKIIESLAKGTKVTVLSKANGWAKIWYNDYVGYIASNYVSDKAPEDTPGVIVPDDPTPTTAPTATPDPTATPAPTVIVIP